MCAIPTSKSTKSLPTSTGRATCVKHIPVSLKSLPISINRATCVAHDKNLSTCRLNVLETDKNPTLSRICKFAFSSLTNSTLSQRERVKFGFTLAEVFSPCRKVKLNFGFTLAEVLITLGIIGVVAVLTIAPLVQKYQEKCFIAKLEKAYSILSTAYKLAVQENGSSKDWGLGDSDRIRASQIFMEKMKPYLNVAQDCGVASSSTTKHKCFDGKNHDYLGNELRHTYYINSYSLALSDGMVLTFSGRNSKEANFADGQILVDLNGKAKPNRNGVDIFAFYIYDDYLEPEGKLNPKRNTYNWSYCKPATEDSILGYGWACTAWVLQNKNMDYIRCRDELNWYTKTKCN